MCTGEGERCLDARELEAAIVRRSTTDGVDAVETLRLERHRTEVRGGVGERDEAAVKGPDADCCADGVDGLSLHVGAVLSAEAEVAEVAVDVNDAVALAFVRDEVAVVVANVGDGCGVQQRQLVGDGSGDDGSGTLSQRVGQVGRFGQ